MPDLQAWLSIFLAARGLSWALVGGHAANIHRDELRLRTDYDVLVSLGGRQGRVNCKTGSFSRPRCASARRWPSPVGDAVVRGGQLMAVDTWSLGLSCRAAEYLDCGAPWRCLVGPPGFEPGTNGFALPRRFRRARTISSPASSVAVDTSGGRGTLLACD